jgi:two-component sensor histidine kinase
VITDMENNTFQTRATVTDISIQKKAEKQIKASLNEKEILLQEINHRVKNNMQVISSLFNLQKTNIIDPKMRDILEDAQNRVQAMAMIHETLLNSENLSSIDMQDYFAQLANSIFQNFGKISNGIDLKIDANNILIGFKQATTAGLIVNELVSNSLKHAFPNNKEGKIKITLRQIEQDQIELTYYDNGIGIPEDFDWDNSKSLGMSLIKLLSERQLNGSLELNREMGTCFIIKFKKEEKATEVTS